MIEVIPGKDHRWSVGTGTFNDGAGSRADAEKITRSYITRLLQLTLLAPDIQESIHEGRQPNGMMFSQVDGVDVDRVGGTASAICSPPIEAVIRSSDGLTEPIHERLPARKGEVVWAAREEMARTVDDFLARRTRSLLLDARAAAEAAPEVARILAAELRRPPEWADEQVAAFQSLAAGYVLD